MNCDPNAIEISTLSCGSCQCKTGFVGPGELCGEDTDNDGWSDVDLNCSDKSCTKDNCVGVPNSGQENVDNDKFGDACDNDIDDDGVLNCLEADCIDDNYDNCPYVVNADQLDTDEDGSGDDCDDDKDNDGIVNTDDNCPIVFNPYQEDSDSNGVGNLCENDCDGDGIMDDEDVCPCNKNIDKTNFRGIKALSLGENIYNQDPPVWELRDDGKEIIQKINSAPGIAIGEKKFSSVEFEGTIFIGGDKDNDLVGSVFSFQVKYYLSLSMKM